MQVEAGLVGLMAVGLIFMIIDFGVLPTRLKFGEGEAEWQTATGQAVASQPSGVSNRP